MSEEDTPPESASERPRRYAAVDPGTVRVGLAIADEAQSIALPRGSVSGAGSPVDVATRIGEAFADDAPTTIVVGCPIGLDGTEGTAAKRSRRLARAIRDTLGVKVLLADERLTTAQATRGLAELGVRGPDARARVDAAAAAVLLQSVLDRRKSRAWRPENEPPRSGSRARAEDPTSPHEEPSVNPSPSATPRPSPSEQAREQSRGNDRSSGRANDRPSERARAPRVEKLHARPKPKR